MVVTERYEKPTTSTRPVHMPVQQISNLFLGMDFKLTDGQKKLLMIVCCATL